MTDIRRLPAHIKPYACTGDDDLWHYDASCDNEGHMLAALDRSRTDPKELPGATWLEVCR